MGSEVRVFRVETSTLSPDSLSIGDLIDICEAADVAPADLAPMIRDETQGIRRLKALAAMAWIIFRRDEPELTLADVMRGRVELVGVATGDANPT